MGVLAVFLILFLTIIYLSTQKGNLIFENAPFLVTSGAATEISSIINNIEVLINIKKKKHLAILFR